MADFDAGELHAIGLMTKAAQTLPDDFWLVAGMQELACLYARIEPLLTAQQRATLIGAGALMAREARREMTAEIEAKMLLARISGRFQEGQP